MKTSAIVVTTLALLAVDAALAHRQVSNEYSTAPARALELFID